MPHKPPPGILLLVSTIAELRSSPRVRTYPWARFGMILRIRSSWVRVMPAGSKMPLAMTCSKLFPAAAATAAPRTL